MEEFKGKVFIFANKWLRSEFSHRRVMHIIEKLNSGESLGVKEFCTSVGKEWIDFINFYLHFNNNFEINATASEPE